MFDLLSEQYVCPECQEEQREAMRNARAQSPFTPEQAFPGRPEYARNLREKYMTKALSKAWTVLKGGFSELDMVFREQGEAAALEWLAQRGIAGEQAMMLLYPDY